MDLHQGIITALRRARAFTQQREFFRAAASYEKASDLMTIYAEQAFGREAEARRKARALQYREIAHKLRSGEWSVLSEGPPWRARVEGEPDRSAFSADSPAPGNGVDGSKELASRATGSFGEGGSPEIRAVVSSLIRHADVRWDDIGGLHEAKNEIKYALGISLARPPRGVKLTSWTRILLYGPPGTGKTLLAAATSRALHNADGIPSVFFNVKVSSVLSKYFGESSRILSELFGMARDTSPAVVFLDEFESLCAKRDQWDTGAERRIMSTLLSELDGLEQKGRTDLYVLTIAATNRPWDLDPAILSRFEKRIFLSLPDAATRREILRIHTEKRGFACEADLDRLAAGLDGFSGREIERLSKDVCQAVVRELNPDLAARVDEGIEKIRNTQIRLRPLLDRDFKRAQEQLRPQTSSEERRRYEQWAEK